MTATVPTDDPIVLQEWREDEVALDLRQARALAAVSKAHIAVKPGESGWLVKPSQMVGTVHVGGQRFVIRSKIGMRNTLAMLDVSPRELQWQRELSDYDSEPDLLVAVVRLFRRGLDRALTQGLRRDYRPQEERLPSIRGRIDMAAAVRRPGPIVPIACRFDEYTADVRVNQLLLAAIHRSLRVPGVPDEDRLHLRRHLLQFEEVEPARERPDWVDSWIPNRLERHYEAAVRPASLILRNTSLVDLPGGRTATTFLLDMNKLVEKFIEDRLTRFLEGRLEVSGQKTLRLDDDRRIPIKPDLIFYRNREPVFVADVKYKQFDTLTGDNTDDLYQLHTYAQVLGLGSGALISCVTDASEGGTTDKVTVQQTGVQLHLWPVDLRQSLPDIEVELLRVAHLIESTTSQRR